MFLSKGRGTMQDKQGKDRIAARLALAGVRRRSAAGAAHVSYSAINHKLRGERPLLPADARRLDALAVQLPAAKDEDCK